MVAMLVEQGVGVGCYVDSPSGVYYKIVHVVVIVCENGPLWYFFFFILFFLNKHR